MELFLVLSAGKRPLCDKDVLLVVVEAGDEVVVDVKGMMLVRRAWSR